MVSPEFGTVGLWRFDEGTGLTAADASGNGLDGSLVGLTQSNWSSDCKFGNCLSFPGTAGYVVVAASPVLNVSQITFEAWVNMTGPGSGGYPRIFGWQNYAFEVANCPNNQTLCVFLPSISWNDTGFVLQGVGWVHIAVTHDGAVLKVYANGSLIGSYAGAMSLNNGPVFIDSAYTGNENFNGRIDEVRLLNYALDAGQIANDAQVKAFPFSARLSINAGATWQTLPYSRLNMALVSGGQTANDPFYLTASSFNLAGSMTDDTNKIEFAVKDIEGNVATSTFNILVPPADFFTAISGTLSGVLSASSSPYKAAGDILVAQGETLFIEPGVVIKMAPNVNWTVKGTLISSGTAQDPVIFTSLADDSVGGDTGDDGPTSGSAEQWGHLTFSSTSKNCVLNNTNIRFGKTVQIIDSSPGFINSSFDNHGTFPIIMTPNSFLTGSGNTASDNTFNAITIAAGQYYYYPPWNYYPDLNVLAATGTWKNLGLPYLLIASNQGGNFLNIKGSLTLDPGVVVKASTATIYISPGGSLNVQGTQADPVIFTSFRDASAGGQTVSSQTYGDPQRNDWQGIQVQPGGSFQMNQAKMKWAANALQFQGSTVTVSNAIMEQISGSAVTLTQGADATLTDVQISTAATGIYLVQQSNLDLGFATIERAYNGIDLRNNSSAQIANTKLLANSKGLTSESGSTSFIHDSIIQGNSEFGVLNQDPAIELDATRNFWGNPAGPRHLTNPSGIGDKVSDHVSFIPFLTSPSEVVVDTAAPNVAISTPLANAVLSRPITVQVFASDNRGIAVVAFLVDGSTVSQKSLAPFNFFLDVAGFTDGPHQLIARAIDVDGNANEDSIPIIVSYAPPPTPVLTAPLDNFLTPVSTIAVSGFAEARTTATLYVNDIAMANAVVSQDGTFLFPKVFLFAEGAQVITAVSSDKRGSSPKSVPIHGVLDTGPPNPPTGQPTKRLL
ncbi:MAG: hypothetical protein HY747_06700 [Elusimicrobia bacterium]|nr:hypothetical protein [Elusimicrobiota bacterium]